MRPAVVVCSMKLIRYLSRLGYGSRREVEHLFRIDAVTRADGATLAATDEVRELAETVGGSAASAASALTHADIRVRNEPLDVPFGSVVLLHKPAGYVCSTADRHPLVYELLPARFKARTPVIAPVGRLDRETTGLLLLTDDGPLLHRLTSPKSHVPKSYRVQLAENVSNDALQLFASGTLMLHGESKALLPAQLEIITERDVRVTITEGRYHQVRRMFAATGNHVQSLHRESMGTLTLHDLPPGAWRVLNDAERAALDTQLQIARSAGGTGGDNTASA